MSNSAELKAHSDQSLNCHCGSNFQFADCCLPFLLDEAWPATAESLMRSRFSAFATGKIAYIVNTCSPIGLQKADELQSWCNETEFKRLEMIACNKGLATDLEGTVEFIAWVKEKGKLKAIHEKSKFVKLNNRWFYVGGNHLPTKMPGPNEPCPCGSKAKYKKCCGR